MSAYRLYLSVFFYEWVQVVKYMSNGGGTGFKTRLKIVIQQVVKILQVVIEEVEEIGPALQNHIYRYMMNNFEKIEPISYIMYSLVPWVVRKNIQVYIEAGQVC